MNNVADIISAITTGNFNADELLAINRVTCDSLKIVRAREAQLVAASLTVNDRVTLTNIRPRHYEGRQGVVKSFGRGNKVQVLLDGETFPVTVPASTLRKHASVAPSAAPKRAESAILADIANAYAGLSPENLSCDGELSVTQVKNRSAALNSELARLFAELGRFVSESDAYELTRTAA